MSATLAKCKCQHCNQKIEFDSDSAGATVTCPGCGMDTLLFIPQSSPEPSTIPASKKNMSTLWGGLFLLAIVIAVMIVWSRLTDNAQDEGPGIPAMIVSGVIWMCAAVFGICIYFLPAIVASQKKKRNRQAIFILNLCVGWTFIGWVIALVWACTVDPEPAK